MSRCLTVLLICVLFKVKWQHFFTVFATKVAVDVGGRQWTFLRTPSLLQYRDIFVPMHSNSPFFPSYAQFLVLRHMWRRSILSVF